MAGRDGDGRRHHKILLQFCNHHTNTVMSAIKIKLNYSNTHLRENEHDECVVYIYILYSIYRTISFRVCYGFVTLSKSFSRYFETVITSQTKRYHVMWWPIGEPYLVDMWIFFFLDSIVFYACALAPFFISCPEIN